MPFLAPPRGRATLMRGAFTLVRTHRRLSTGILAGQRNNLPLAEPIELRDGLRL
jgi:hypothetical protein